MAHWFNSSVFQTSIDVFPADNIEVLRSGSHGVHVAADGEGFDRRGGAWTPIGRGGWSRVRYTAIVILKFRT